MIQQQLLFALFKTKLKNTFCNRQQVVMLLLLPLFSLFCLWAMLTFYAEGTMQIPVGIVDLDQTRFSELVINRLEESASIKMIPVNEAAVRNSVQNGTLEAAIVIPDGFSARISESSPEALITLISPTSGVSSSLITELLTAQVARLYFAGDAATMMVKEHSPQPVNDTERALLWEEAFLFADSFWEPDPLMSITFTSLSIDMASASNESTALPNVQSLVNSLLLTLISALFFTYVVFCILACAGTVITERENGILLRIKSCNIPIWQWLALTTMVPFLLFGLPSAVLFSLLLVPGTLISSLFFLLLFSVLGVCAAYRVKTPSTWRTLSLILVAVCFFLFLSSAFLFTMNSR